MCGEYSLIVWPLYPRSSALTLRHLRFRMIRSAMVRLFSAANRIENDWLLSQRRRLWRRVGMATITIRCPSTGIRVSTGIQTEAEVFKTLPHIQAVLSRCPACGVDHFWTTSMAEIEARRPLEVYPTSSGHHGRGNCDDADDGETFLLAPQSPPEKRDMLGSRAWFLSPGRPLAAGS